MLQFTLQQDYGALKYTGASYARKRSLPQKAYNPTIHHTETGALPAQTKIIHLQHSVNSHPIGTYLHVAMICPGKDFLIYTVTQVQGSKAEVSTLKGQVCNA